METALALIAGGFIGAVLGFVGAGGAMLSVPILMYGFGFDPKPATTAAFPNPPPPTIPAIAE